METPVAYILGVLDRSTSTDAFVIAIGSSDMGGRPSPCGIEETFPVHSRSVVATISIGEDSTLSSITFGWSDELPHGSIREGAESVTAEFGRIVRKRSVASSQDWLGFLRRRLQRVVAASQDALVNLAEGRIASGEVVRVAGAGDPACECRVFSGGVPRAWLESWRPPESVGWMLEAGGHPQVHYIAGRLRIFAAKPAHVEPKAAPRGPSFPKLVDGELNVLGPRKSILTMQATVKTRVDLTSAKRELADSRRR